ncbi:hypothetical protein IHE45_05G003100 [Dioscorea alata]|uniref:Uncharacterized protein n=1 Tax=Dioscorea alata TaxID=55571 RepID=A0ACB7VYT6_DIOAL|nr:hypothetical protein IHE45_05G003100 [Dioscorea alata]
MARRLGRAYKPPPQMDFDLDYSDPRPPFARPGVRRACAGVRHPPPRHAPECYEFAGYPPGGNVRWNENFVHESPSTWDQGRGRAAPPPRRPRCTPAYQVDNDDDSSSSSSSSDDEPEFRDMDIVIDGNRIMNAKGAKIVTGVRVKRDLRVRISNNKIGS